MSGGAIRAALGMTLVEVLASMGGVEGRGLRTKPYPFISTLGSALAPDGHRARPERQEQAEADRQEQAEADRQGHLRDAEGRVRGMSTLPPGAPD